MLWPLSPPRLQRPPLTLPIIEPPRFSKDYYFWSDGFTPSSGDYAYGTVCSTCYYESWGGGQPDFWGSPPEQSAEWWMYGGNDWNDLRGDNANRYVNCKQWSEHSEGLCNVS